MKLNLGIRLTLLFLILLLNLPALLGQTVRFNSGDFEVVRNVHSNFEIQLSSEELHSDFVYRYLTFSVIPDEEYHVKIVAAGIELIEYLPENTYLARLPKTISFETLNQIGAISIFSQKAEHKLSPDLFAASFAPVLGEDVAVMVRYHEGITDTELAEFITEPSLEMIKLNSQSRIGHANVAATSLKDFALNPVIRYVQKEPPVAEPESDDGRNLHRSNMIDVDYWGGRDYDGTGVNMAVNDDGFVGPHIDFQGRTYQGDVAGDLVGTHGDGVAGIMGSAGNLNPNYRGMAPGSFLYIRQYDSDMPGTVQLHQDSAVMVFNSSYSNGCNAGYTSTTQLVDEEQFDNPSLMQVFSAGNSNGLDCDYGAGNQWGNVTGGHKIAKNCIATANLDNEDNLTSSSSRGPASDGRIKPDIAAHGADQISNEPDFGYNEFGGTSAAAPGIAGVLAQLYQAYRELYLEEAPAGLLKAVLLNTATDLGNTGPDFKYGWGKVNAFRALKTLEDGRYIQGEVDQGETDQIQIQIPSGVRLAKVMVYWPDMEASTNAAIALVNDIDCSVVDPSLATHLPYILDSSPNATALNTPATVGEDHLNNMEQITLADPAIGTYELNIIGTTIPFGAHTYYVTYEFLTDELELVYPLGGEGLVPGNTSRIHWDAYGTSEGFELELSLDNGGSWISIGNELGFERFSQFQVPDTVVSTAKVRVTRGLNSSESDTSFSIIGTPENLEFNNVCNAGNSYNFTLKWDSVAGATSYDVFKLGAQYMDSIATITDLEIDLSIGTDSIGWYSVRARSFQDAIGTRAVAVPFGWLNSEAPCLLSCSSDDDVGITSILSPIPGSLNCGSGQVEVNVQLENLGTNDQTGFEVAFSFDGLTIIETYQGNLAAGGSDIYVFTAMMPSPFTEGPYPFSAWVMTNQDNTHCNDSLSVQIQFEEAISDVPYEEDYESGIFPPDDGSIVINQDGLNTWLPITVVGSDGNSTTAMYVDNFNYDVDVDNQDIFRLPALDLANIGVALLTFDVAHRPYPSFAYKDSLRVDVSTDCGVTFDQVYLKVRTDLATGGLSSNEFFPEEADEWRTDSIDLSSYIGTKALIQFVNIADRGNNIYLDNINLATGYTGVGQSSQVSDISVFPNPTSNYLTIDLGSKTTNPFEYNLIDLSGKNVLIGQVLTGENSVQIYLDGIAPGQYVLKVHFQGQVPSQFKITKL